MQTDARLKHFFKAAITAGLLMALFIGGLEYYWRSKGYPLSFNDDKALWTLVRKELKSYTGPATVFIGSSRIKFDIDIPTWEKLTGERSFQLAIVGTSPRLVLLDLARDENFKGKLIVDVMDPLNFGADTMRSELFAREALEYYHHETPAQAVSAALNFRLESRLLCLEEGKFGLNSLVKELSQENRAGVLAPTIPWRKELTYVTNRRQSKLTPFFLGNPQAQKAHIEHWKKRAGFNSPVAFKPGALDSICLQYKTAIDRIRARGGTVVFLREPSNDVHLERELKFFPRKVYWDHLLSYTNTPGFHFSDYPATAGMICPEGSHLAPEDAVKYTSWLVQTLRKEQNWKFASDNKQP